MAISALLWVCLCGPCQDMQRRLKDAFIMLKVQVSITAG